MNGELLSGFAVTTGACRPLTINHSQFTINHSPLPLPHKDPSSPMPTFRPTHFALRLPPPRRAPLTVPEPNHHPRRRPAHAHRHVRPLFPPRRHLHRRPRTRQRREVSNWLIGGLVDSKPIPQSTNPPIHQSTIHPLTHSPTHPPQRHPTRWRCFVPYNFLTPQFVPSTSNCISVQLPCLL